MKTSNPNKKVQPFQKVWCYRKKHKMRFSRDGEKLACIDLDQIRDKLEEILPRTDVSLIMRAGEWRNFEFRNQQLTFVYQKVPEISGRTLTFSELGYVFSISKGAAWKILHSFRDEPNPRGRPHALTEEQENEVLAIVEQNWQTKEALPPTGLLLSVNARFGTELTYGWLQSFVIRHANHIRLAPAMFQESDRLDVPREFFMKYFAEAHQFLDGKVAELVFNIDEVGASDWEDKHGIQTIVPAVVTEPTVQYKVSRKFQHSTLVGCISAAGDSAPALIISHRADDKKIWDLGWREGKDFMLRHRQKCYMTTELFLEYLDRIVIPFINYIRSSRHLENSVAVIMMDNCSSHVNSDVLQLLSVNGIIGFTFPPHTTNLLQPLDLVLFGLFKRAKLLQEPELPRSSLEGQILLLQESYEKVCVKRNVRASFRKAGITLNCSQQPYTVRFDEDLVAQNPGFQQLWNANYDIARLTERRQRKPYGALNADDILNTNDSTN
jgi:hypothetical protein